MLGFIIILIIIICVLSAYIVLYKRGIRSIINSLEFIRDNDTNKKINLRIKSKELNKLSILLNHIIDNFTNEKLSISKAQQNFKEEITNISHDLRTPLTSIAGYVQMLESEKASKIKKDEYFGIIRRRIETLIRMLDELYDYARIESDEYQLQLEKVNINNALSDVISLYYYDFTSRGEEPFIDLTSTPIYIYADKDAITRVFHNLMKNYLIHGSGNLSISVKEKEESVCISFKNYAPYLDNTEVDRLFNRFFTADKSRTKKTTGLGLSIVKDLVTKMDGRVDAYLDSSYLIINIFFESHLY